MEQSNTSDTPFRRCILHVPEKLKPKKQRRCNTLPFDENNWRVVQTTARNRRAKPQFATSIYHDIVIGLPSRPTKNDGYHVACYQNFTAVTSVKISSEKDKPDASSENVPLFCTVSNTNDDTRPRSSAIPAVSCFILQLDPEKEKRLYF